MVNLTAPTPLPPPSGSRTLPLELWDRVAQLLSVHSLTQLALVDKQFNTVAERYLYSNFYYPHNCSKPGFSRCSRHSCICQGEKFLQSLMAKPERAQHVKNISVQLTPYTPMTNALDLLSLTADNLQCLRLEIAPGFWPQSSLWSLQSLLRARITSFPKLRQLSLPNAILNTQLLNVILPLTQSISFLSFKPSEVHVSSRQISIIHPDAQLKDVQTLELHELGIQELPQALEVLNLASKISSLTFTTVSSLVSSPRWNELIEKIRARMFLESLTTQMGHRWQWDIGGFDHLKDLTLSRPYVDCFVIDFGEIKIPPLPELETLNFTIDGSNDPTRVFLCQRSHYPSPACVADTSAPLAVPFNIYDQVFSAPRLTKITFHTRVAAPGSHLFPEMDVYPPLVDQTEVIRIKTAHHQYQRLVWCRVSSHLLRKDVGQLIHCDKVIDQEWISVGSVAVSKESFSRLRELEDVELMWESPERVARLGADTWKALI